MAETTLDTTDRRIDRWLVAIAVAVGSLVLWKGALDPLSMTKATVAAACAVVAVAVALWRALQRTTLRLPSVRTDVAALCFLAAALLSLALSSSLWRSLLGQRNRVTGVALYAVCVVLYFVASRSFDAGRSRKLLAGALVPAGAVASIHALLQRVGVDPFDANLGEDGRLAAASTFGNVNFIAGFLGIVVPASAWLVVAGRGRTRVVAASVAVLSLAAILVGGSAQGIFASAAGVGVLAVAVLALRGDRRGRIGIAMVVLAGVVVGLLSALGIVGRGPLSRLEDAGTTYRGEIWRAALETFTDDSVTGVGFDMFAGHYRQDRRPMDGVLDALEREADSPHNVPFGMFVSGGVVLGLAYLSFVLATASLAVRGWRRGDREQRLLVAGLAAAWVGYQVQAFVSIDVPPLPVLHFVLAGLIAAVVLGPARREIDLPWLRASPKAARVGRPAGVPRPWVSRGMATGVAAVVGLAGLYVATRPIRADLEAKAAIDALADTDARIALRHVRDARRLLRDEAEYLNLMGRIFLLAAQNDFALQAYTEALERDDRSFENVLNAARAAEAAGEPQRIVDLYRRAIELEPNNLELAIEAVEALRGYAQLPEAEAILRAKVEAFPDVYQVLRDTGRQARAMRVHDLAIEIHEQATELEPDLPAAWIDLARTLDAAGDGAAARTAYERALELDPSNEAAASGLERLEP